MFSLFSYSGNNIEMFIKNLFLRNIMSLLEDRLLRIIELRKSGLEDDAIAAELGVDNSVVRNYEDSTRRIIEETTSKGVCELETIAQKAGLSPILTDMFMKHYDIEIPEKSNYVSARDSYTRERLLERRIRIDMIMELAEKGFNAKEIAEKTGLKVSSVRRYAH